MTLTREQADKINVELHTILGKYFFDDTLHIIQAECLAKWAYRRVKTWPDLLAACEAALTVINKLHPGNPEEARYKLSLERKLEAAITKAIPE